MENKNESIFLRPASRLYPRVDAAVAEVVRDYESRHFQQLGVQSKMWYYNGLSRPDYVHGDPYWRLERLEGCGLGIYFGRGQGLTPCGNYNDTAGTSGISIGGSSGAFNTSSFLSLPENPQRMLLNIHGDDFKAVNPSTFPLFLENGNCYVITGEVLLAFANWLNRNAFLHIEDIEIPVHRESETPKASIAEAAKSELERLSAPALPALEPVFAEEELSDEDRRMIANGWTRHAAGTWSAPAPDPRNKKRCR